jgi:hypothetical protein
MDELDKRIAKAYELLEYYKEVERENSDETVKIEATKMCNNIRTLIGSMCEFDKTQK